MISVARFDIGSVKGEAVLTDEGYIRANAIVTRTGIFLYQNPDGSVRKELRHPDDVWQDASIKSMHMIPITNGHPQERLVTPENFKRLAIGFTGENVTKQDNFVMANIVITDQDGINAVVKSGRKELSLGYLVDLDETKGVYDGEEYDARQTNIRYNHLAIVDKARAGSDARIALDELDAVEINKPEVQMAKRKIKIDSDQFEVEESVGAYIERLEKDMKNLQDERDRVEEEIKIIRDKLDKVSVERDSLKDTQSGMGEQKMDSSKFNSAVNEKVKLIEIAKEYLGSDILSKLDSMSNEDIKKSVIQVAKKTVNVDGKSQVYLDAMFDLIVSEKSEKKVNVDNVTFSKTITDHSESVLHKARNDMIEREKNYINQKSQEV